MTSDPTSIFSFFLSNSGGSTLSAARYTRVGTEFCVYFHVTFRPKRTDRISQSSLHNPISLFFSLEQRLLSLLFHLCNSSTTFSTTQPLDSFISLAAAHRFCSASYMRHRVYYAFPMRFFNPDKPLSRATACF